MMKRQVTVLDFDKQTTSLSSTLTTPFKSIYFQLCMWSFTFFFYNKRLKRIVMFNVRAVSGGYEHYEDSQDSIDFLNSGQFYGFYWIPAFWKIYSNQYLIFSFQKRPAKCTSRLAQQQMNSIPGNLYSLQETNCVNYFAFRLGF